MYGADLLLPQDRKPVGKWPTAGAEPDRGRDWAANFLRAGAAGAAGPVPAPGLGLVLVHSSQAALGCPACCRPKIGHAGSTTHNARLGCCPVASATVALRCCVTPPIEGGVTQRTATPCNVTCNAPIFSTTWLPLQ
jgi:hypothetical protein